MSYTRPKNLKRKLKNSVLLVFGLYVMVIAILYFFQENFLFRPETLPQDYTYQLSYKYNEYFLDTQDNGLINTLHIKAGNPKGVIIYFHGNAGNLKRWSKIVEYFVDMDYDVYIMDYRTYGKSKGELSENALYNDAQVSYDHLKQFWKEENIIVYGRSLGSAMATKIASLNSPKKLILESPFYNIADVAKKRFPIFPINNLLKYQFPNNEHIKSVQSSIYIVHGTNDNVVPFKSGEKLFKVSPKDKTTFTAIENGGHNNLIEFDLYHKLIKEILQ